MRLGHRRQLLAEREKGTALGLIHVRNNPDPRSGGVLRDLLFFLLSLPLIFLVYFSFTYQPYQPEFIRQEGDALMHAIFQCWVDNGTVPTREENCGIDKSSRRYSNWSYFLSDGTHAKITVRSGYYEAWSATREWNIYQNLQWQVTDEERDLSRQVLRLAIAYFLKHNEFPRSETELFADGWDQAFAGWTISPDTTGADGISISNTERHSEPLLRFVLEDWVYQEY